MNETPFHIRIKQLREKRELSKADVAKGIGISTTAYYFYEIGKHRPSSIELYRHIASVLGCEVSYLTFDDKRFSQMKEKTVEDMIINGDSPDDTMMTFGQKLRRLRERKGMSRDEVADLAAIAHSSYGKYETDTNLPLHEDSYDRLAEVLGCDVSYLKDGAKEALMAHHDSKKEFGRRIRSARESVGISISELAGKVGIPVSTLSKYELGYNRPMDVGFYDILAGALGVDSKIFKELDPRCVSDSGYAETPAEAVWETISGVYPDDELPELKPLTENVSEETDSGKTAESDIQPVPSKEDKEEVPHDPETTADATLRPADLMHEIMKITSRLSALLAGNRLTREEKDIIKASLDMAYKEGIE